VVVPVLSFVAAALILSCGGGGGGSSGGVGQAFTIEALAICSGSPPAPTPTPSPTKTQTPKATPTPQCTPVQATTVPTSGPTPTVQFNAQGTFAKPSSKKLIFFDATNAASWFSGGNPPLFTGKATYSGNPPGQWTGVTKGCTCIAAQSGGIESQTVTLGVATPAASCPTCPAVLPTPTP
jgi:hypothetical protein